MTHAEGDVINGVPWQEAIAPCKCGRQPAVWRKYGTKAEYAVRCSQCRIEVHDRSRKRCILRWNDFRKDDVSPPYHYGWEEAVDPVTEDRK